MVKEIICENLSLGYEGKAVVQNLNFTLPAGRWLCVVGENGSGKTTLVHALLGLTKPLCGKICKDGFQTGWLPQQMAVQKDFPASVEEVVLSGRLPHLGKRLFYNGADRKQAKEKMELLQVESLRKKSFHALSGGQRQRVLLARALAAGDELLVLDEPAAGLDVLVTAQLYELTKLLVSKGMTVVMVSHDISAATEYADDILHLGRGGQLYFGVAKEYAKSEAGKRFLGGEPNV